MDHLKKRGGKCILERKKEGEILEEVDLDLMEFELYAL